ARSPGSSRPTRPRSSRRRSKSPRRRLVGQVCNLPPGRQVANLPHDSSCTREGTMRRRYLSGLFLLTAAGWLAWAAPGAAQKAADAKAPEGWPTAAPRDEIRPAFAYEPAGGPGGKGAFVIKHDRREGLDGCWTRTFPVSGGKYYQFQVLFKARGVAVPR